MAGAPQPSKVRSNNNTEGVNYTKPFIVITCLFFMWAVVTNANDVLIPYLKRACELTDFQSSFVQSFFFGAYFLMSIPAGKILHFLGYKKGIIVGLMLMLLGALVFIPSALTLHYYMFLFGLFLLGSGVTLLQVAANPYVSLLGKSETASTRLNLAQGFNSLGAAIAPILFAEFLFEAKPKTPEEYKALLPAEQLAYRLEVGGHVILPYIVLAVVLGLLATVIYFSQLPSVEEDDEELEAVGVIEGGKSSAWQYSHLTLGVLAIFMYVGAEVSIGSFLIRFAQQEVAGLSEIGAAIYPSLYMFGAMIGRFVGSAVMTKISPRKAVAFNAFIAVLLVIGAMVTKGYTALYLVSAVGLCNSIMFPTIFTIAIEKLGKFTKQGASYLVMAIVGGGVIPPIMGYLSDGKGIQFSFIVPVLCYVYILFYGLIGSKVKEA